MEPSLVQSNARSGNGFVSFVMGLSMLAIYVGGVALMVAIGLIAERTGSSDLGNLGAIAGMFLGGPVFMLALVVNIVGLILGIIAVARPKVTNEGRYAKLGIAINMLPPGCTACSRSGLP